MKRNYPLAHYSLPPETLEKIEAIAERERRSKSNTVARAIDVYYEQEPQRKSA
jgi:predicted transcriptional regulator